jgi:opacity protein-like surface antigen
MTPGWILDIAAALMLAVAAVSAVRLAAARPWQHGSVVADTDIAHLLMAIAMAGMLVADLSTLPDAAWEVIFGVLTAWFGYRVIRDARMNGTRALAGGHCAPHLVHSAAMLYMFLALGPAGVAGQGMNGMGGSSAMQSLKVPTLGLVFAFILAGYTIWDLDQVSSRNRRLAPAGFALAGVRASAGATMPVSAAFSGTSGNGREAGDSGQEAGSLDVAAAPAASSGARGTLLSPGMTVACRIAMGATMTFMLLIMI